MRVITLLVRFNISTSNRYSSHYAHFKRPFPVIRIIPRLGSGYDPGRSKSYTRDFRDTSVRAGNFIEIRPQFGSDSK